MKREFLQSLSVGDTPLPKEVIDAIMAENGRDIENAKSAFCDYDDLKNAKQQLEEEHARQLDDLRFSHLLERQADLARSRNHKAVFALLDLPALQQSEHREDAVTKAIEDLKKENPYLFDAATPPLYARGTGVASGSYEQSPTTLAGALKQRYGKERMY